MMRKLFVSLTILAAAGAWCAEPLQLTGGEAVSVGVYIAPVEEEAEPLAEQSAGRLLTPASILKSLTVATALDSLGGDFHWHTRVYAIGQVDQAGTLHGRLVVEGGGDPTLGSRHFREQPAFVAAVRQALADHGIKRIEGAVEQGRTWPSEGAIASWQVEDIPWDYGAGFYTLNYADNAVNIDVPSMRISPSLSGVTAVNALSATGGGSLDLQRGAGAREFTVSGSLGQRKQATLNASMPYPADYLLESLRSGLSYTKASVSGSSSESMLILDYTSPRLSEVARSLMVRSDNTMAEGTLRALAAGSSLSAALSAEQRHWRRRGVDLSTVRLRDGSGLSRVDAIAPKQLGAVLRRMASNADYVAVFARAGQDGTLRSFLADNPRAKEFVLKTGSMNGILCYAGYRLDPSTRKPTHVIVIMTNNLQASTTATRQAVERFLLQLDF
jgi:D-alanyl-D-alanine carboxypeptidase/D-alanyl-D-alanine-endopeptidase (penicillin-binding protein 4)